MLAPQPLVNTRTIELYIYIIFASGTTFAMQQYWPPTATWLLFIAELRLFATARAGVRPLRRASGRSPLSGWLTLIATAWLGAEEFVVLALHPPKLLRIGRRIALT